MPFVFARQETTKIPHNVTWKSHLQAKEGGIRLPISLFRSGTLPDCPSMPKLPKMRVTQHTLIPFYKVCWSAIPQVGEKVKCLVHMLPRPSIASRPLSLSQRPSHGDSNCPEGNPICRLPSLHPLLLQLEAEYPNVHFFNPILNVDTFGGVWVALSLFSRHLWTCDRIWELELTLHVWHFPLLVWRDWLDLRKALIEVLKKSKGKEVY